MKETLFEVPQDRKTDRSKTRAERRAQVAKWKEQHGIYTHNCPPDLGWLALSMPECCNAVKGYGLTEAEKTNGAELMAGYCRLLEEAGLLADGYPTEYEAARAIAERIESK